MDSLISYLKKTMYLPVMVLIFFIMAFVVDTPKQIFEGYIDILVDPSILLTDFIVVGGLGATFFNVGTVTLFNIIMIRKLDLRISGLVYSGIMCISGFAFFGKTLFNSLPIYLGIYIYARIKKIPYKNLIISILFSTGISPLVSYCVFGFSHNIFIGLTLGIVSGILAGLMIPALASHTIKFHQGYNLLNTGFALGIVSLLFHAAFKAVGLSIKTASLLSTQYSDLLLILCTTLSMLFCIVSVVKNKPVFKKYGLLCKKSGRLVSDFIRDFGREASLLNVGLLGLMVCAICFIFDIKINGPIFGTLITVMGFGSSGLHIKNALPVFIGALATVFVSIGDLTQTSVVLAMFFSIGVAPIAGQYGFIMGIISGATHVLIAPLVLSFQGGFDLYNNGFAAGFASCIVIVMIEAFKKEEKI